MSSTNIAFPGMGSTTPTTPYNPFSSANVGATLGTAGIAGAAGAFPTPASGTTTPNLTPENEALLSQLGAQYSHLASTGVNLEPYQQQQEQGINTNSNIQAQAAQQALAARGLANSPVSGAVAANEAQQRTGQITNLQQSIPLLQNQLQQQNLNAAAGFTASIPHGTTTTTSTGGGIGGFLGGVGGILGAALSGAAKGAVLSDKRLKDNVTDTTDGLDKILALKPKEYNYKPEVDGTGGGNHSGFLAQDLEKHLPNTVVTDEHSGLKAVKYHELIPKIVKAIQELHDKVGEVAKNSAKTVQPKGVTT
jgi:hypothetical protein